ncbi:MAG: hypothetical protein KF757_10640 [Phycisphaeraceae bacterium]|nr:hypothetical protein [Phycisphaeraceae bacterium]MCW5764214.1 hypothetical protein [Phycisphaeraceae bacterium]
MRLTQTAFVAVVAGLSASVLAGPPVSGNVIVREGDIVDGSAVTIINSPFTNGNGQVGLVIGLADGRRAIWFDTGVIFLSSDALPDVLTGGEGTMGVGNNGEFIYSPSYNGNDSVWGQNGLILAGTQAAPGYGANFFSTFNSRPQMIDDGTAFWVGGINNGQGGTASFQRALYKQGPGGAISRVLSSGDVIGNTGGLTVAFPSGINFDYHVSGNGNHYINNLTAATVAASDTMIAVNGSMVAQEGGATGQGDAWQNFDLVSINNSGNYIFTGDTNAATNMDEFIAFNGVIGLREGQMVDGLTLGSAVNAASLNNLNQAVFVWTTVQETETLFFASDASNLAASVKLLSVGDLFDEDNDGIGDWTVTDFNASGIIGPGLDFADDGYVFVEVDLRSLDGSTTIEAIISLRVPSPASAAVLVLGALAAARRRR